MKQIEELYSNLNQLIESKVLDSKRIIAFGTNKPTEKTVLYLKAKGYHVVGIIDNDRSKHGKKMLGIDVFSPDLLKKKYGDNVAVLIASQYFESMSLQLKSYGYKEGTEIFQTIKYTNYDISKDDFDQKIADLKRGASIYQRIVDKYGEDCSIIICPYKGLGDVYFICSYLEAYLQNNLIKKYVLTVIGGSCKRIARMFEIENIEVLPTDESDCLIDFYRILDRKDNNMKVLSHNYLHTDILKNFEFNNRLSWGILLKQCVMNLNVSTPRKEPRRSNGFNKIQKLINEKGLEQGKTVILSPYANTIVRLDDGLWEELADYYTAKGYVVCTNSIGKEEPPISGTVGIEFDLEDAVEVVEYAGTFIGLRSGLCDVISSAKAEKHIIYPTKESLFFNISDMGIGDNVHEWLIDEKKDYRRFLQFIWTMNKIKIKRGNGCVK